MAFTMVISPGLMEASVTSKLLLLAKPARKGSVGGNKDDLWGEVVRTFREFRERQMAGGA